MDTPLSRPSSTVSTGFFGFFWAKCSKLFAQRSRPHPTGAAQHSAAGLLVQLAELLPDLWARQSFHVLTMAGYERLLDDDVAAGTEEEAARPRPPQGGEGGGGVGNPSASQGPQQGGSAQQDGAAEGQRVQSGLAVSADAVSGAIPVAAPVRQHNVQTSHGQMPVATPVEVGLGGQSGPMRRSHTPGDTLSTGGGASDFTMQVSESHLLRVAIFV